MAHCHAEISARACRTLALPEAHTRVAPVAECRWSLADLKGHNSRNAIWCLTLTQRTVVNERSAHREEIGVTGARRFRGNIE
jgi:hypothetical protein